MIIGMGGEGFAGKVTIATTLFQVEGMKDPNQAAELVKRTPSDTLGCQVFDIVIVAKRAVWISGVHLGKACPTLSLLLSA